MRIKIISVGRVRQEFVLNGEGDYLKRLKGNLHVTFEELGLSYPASMSKAEVLAREGKELLKKLKPGDCVIVLDEGGKELTSKQLASKLATWQSEVRSLVFVIGGAFGIDKAVKDMGKMILSLSQLTFAHQLTRLILVEQLYRAYTINAGQPYHKE